MKTILPILKPLLLLICFAMNAHSAPDKTVFDFQSPTNAAWQIVNDDVMEQFAPVVAQLAGT